MKLPKYYINIAYATGIGYRSRSVKDKYEYLNRVVAERALKDKIKVFQKNGYTLESGNESAVSMWSNKQKVRAYLTIRSKKVEVV